MLLHVRIETEKVIQKFREKNHNKEENILKKSMASLILMEKHNNAGILNKLYRIKAENYQTRNIEYLSDDLDAIFKINTGWFVHYFSQKL